MNNINIHLTVIVSTGVPPLVAYDLSDLGVGRFLFVSMFLPAASLSSLSTASLLLYTLGGIAK